jgi:hypothetical protein
MIEDGWRLEKRGWSDVSPDYIFSQKKNMVAYKYINNAVPTLLGYLVADKGELLANHFSD